MRSSRKCIEIDAGFTLVETLVATLMLALATSAAIALATPATTLAQVLPESADMQQRARVAIDAMTHDLLQAGAGIDAGASAGSLAAFIPALLPRRVGLTGADASGVVRADAITVLYAEANFAQTVTSVPIASRTPSLTVEQRPACPVGDALCGLTSGTDVVIFDDQAHFDIFRVVRAAGSVADLQLHDPGPSFVYVAGAYAVSVVSRTYYLDQAARQLRVSDGYQSDAPVVDNVVGLTVSYFGDDGGSVVPLPLAMLNDGPWCGELGNRFDADLLRVRRVRVALRLQAGPDQFRASGPAFAVPGTSRRADQALPDYVVTFDVAPRNLGLAR